MKDTSAKHQQLLAAMRSDVAIRMTRETIEDGWFDGFVVALGSKFVVIELVSDAIYLNGFVCLRVSDIDGPISATPNWKFMKAALALRDQNPRGKAELDCTEASNLLRSIPESIGLISIHIEEVDAEVCYIGRIATIDNEELTLTTISPSAIWDDEPMTFPLSDISRVDYGGAYEEALLLVSQQ